MEVTKPVEPHIGGIVVGYIVDGGVVNQVLCSDILEKVLISRTAALNSRKTKNFKTGVSSMHGLANFHGYIMLKQKTKHIAFCVSKLVSRVL